MCIMVPTAKLWYETDQSQDIISNLFVYYVHHERA